MKLTKEWQPYDGDYEKKIQDIELHNGDIIRQVYPNAGLWNVLKKEGNETYYGKDIPHMDAKFVRLTHDKIW